MSKIRIKGTVMAKTSGVSLKKNALNLKCLFTSGLALQFCR